MSGTVTPFRRILIANRGEIALRIIRTAHALGYQTVAVYSTADADAAHVRAADQAVPIGDAAPAASYLNIPALLAAARRSDADAVHPGYGFLAENADFAAACRAAGLVFIGPSPAAIRAMGDKAAAKARMLAAGVPCIPGYQGDDQRDETLANAAAGIGYPVMIKATAGGGGRGMRRVMAAEHFAAALQSARSEALHAFGDATVILERAIAEPRHIEIQVFADREGRAIHLGERDCSVQRRHQKLIEEAPSPAVDAALRARMGAVAVKAVQAIGYEGAGTLEFLLDASGDFFFMEMNTRLQVEHPVTEAITGLDLVEWQLRVAAGEPLPLDQSAITFTGHAIEVRLCAEDADQGFLPQSGRMQAWQPPPGLRLETALAPGAEVSPHYDSMIAKLIAHGRDRAEALRRLDRGLQALVALGVTTNQRFLARCLQQPTFGAGAATTAFIDEHLDALLTRPEPEAERLAVLTAWLLQETTPGPSAARNERNDRLAPRHPIAVRWQTGAQTRSARVARDTGHAADQWAIETATAVHRLQLVERRAGEGKAGGAGRIRFVLDGLMQSARFVRDGETLWLQSEGAVERVLDCTRASATRHRRTQGDGRIRASLNGRVVTVAVEPGSAVKAGDVLVVVEAMKMEHAHVAEHAGVVVAVHVRPADQVSTGAVLIELGTTAGASE